MKAVTIWQPWASLLAYEEKGFETRGWATAYRGPIAIHAAAISIRRVLKKCFPMGDWSYHPDYQVQRAFLNDLSKAFGVTDGGIIDRLEKLPTKAVIATANLIGCHRIGRMNDCEIGYWDCNRPLSWVSVSDQEASFGDWTPGRFAWEFSDMKIIAPVPASGQQGLWEWGGLAS